VKYDRPAGLLFGRCIRANHYGVLVGQEVADEAERLLRSQPVPA
jgi:hypothetical protein